MTDRSPAAFPRTSGGSRCRRLLPAALAALALAPVAAVPAPAGGWLQFRGPLGNGSAPEGTHLPVALDGPRHLEWKVALPARGISGPIVVGDRVILTAAGGANQDRLHVVCIDARDGGLLWQRRFWATGRTMCHKKTSVAAPTAASDGERIYALFSSNDLFCLDLEGNLIWLRGLTRDYPNASNSLGMASSPLVSGGSLVVQVENDSESFAAGLDLLSGRNKWKLERPKAANWTSPVVLATADGLPAVALQSAKGITAVDPHTGEALWSYEGGAATIPSSAADRGVLFVPSHGLTAIRPSSGGVGEPEQLWREGKLGPATASPVVMGERVFTVNGAGVLTCGRRADGDVLWRLRVKGPFSASPVTAGGHLYLVNEPGLVQVVDGRGAEGVLAGSLDLGETVLGTPAAARGALFVRGERHLFKISGR